MPRALIERWLCGSRRIVHVRLSVLSQTLPDGRPCLPSVCRLGLAVAKLLLMAVCCRHFSVLPHLAVCLLPAFLSVAASCWLAVAGISQCCRILLAGCCRISQCCRI